MTAPTTFCSPRGSLRHRPPPEAKFVLGAPDNQGSCVALLEGLRHYPEPGIWYLGLMLIRPGQRSAGLGSALYREFETLARATGATELRLCVFEASPEALRFWKRQGYSFHRAVPAQPFSSRHHSRRELRKVLTLGHG